MKLKPIRVSGTSMIPTLKEGYVFVDFGVRDFKIGDIVLYSFMGRFYIHRIYGIRDNFFIISNDDDMPFHFIKKSSVFGRVKFCSNGWIGYFVGVFFRTIRMIKKVFYVCFGKTRFNNL